MSNNSKHTQVELVFEADASAIYEKYTCHNVLVLVDNRTLKYDEAREQLLANGNLIIDAFNVTNESGLTPRELLDKLKATQRNKDIIESTVDSLVTANAELLEQKNLLIDMANEHTEQMGALGTKLASVLEQRKELLAYVQRLEWAVNNSIENMELIGKEHPTAAMPLSIQSYREILKAKGKQ